MAPWAPSQYPKRRLSVRSRKVSKPRDRYFKLSYRFEIWQTHRQHCCRSACQISERSDNSKYKSRGFETLQDLTERRLFGYWDGALVVIWWLCISSSGEARKFDFLSQIWPWMSRSNAPKTIGILTNAFCTSDPKLVILAWMGDELWCRQAQNGVNFDFDLKFDLGGQSRLPPKTIGT